MAAVRGAVAVLGEPWLETACRRLKAVAEPHPASRILRRCPTPCSCPEEAARPPNRPSEAGDPCASTHLLLSFPPVEGTRLSEACQTSRGGEGSRGAGTVRVWVVLGEVGLSQQEW